MAGHGGDRGDRAAQGGDGGLGLRSGGSCVAAGGWRSHQGAAVGAGGSSVPGHAGAVADRRAGIHAGSGLVRRDSRALRGLRGLVAEFSNRQAKRRTQPARRCLWRGAVVFFRWSSEQFAHGPDRSSAGGPRWGFARAIGLGGGFDGVAGGLRGLHFHLDCHAVELDRTGAQGRSVQSGAVCAVFPISACECLLPADSAVGAGRDLGRLPTACDALLQVTATGGNRLRTGGFAAGMGGVGAAGGVGARHSRRIPAAGGRAGRCTHGGRMETGV